MQNSLLPRWNVMFCSASLAPLARTKKGGAHRGGVKVNNNDAVAVVREKMALFRAILEPNFA